MSCSPPGIDNGQVVTFDVTQCTAVYSCDTGYAMVGSGVLVFTTPSPAGAGAWSGSAECELSFVNNVWFWFLVGLSALLAITALTLLCVYCYRRCFRMRSRRVQARPNEEEGQRPNPTPRSSRQDPGCFEYGGKCDVCCVDYYGCCSLLGCCGFHGSCACCCSCCRCCREPEEGPGISSLPVSIFRKWKQKAKGSRMNVTRPVLVIQYNKAKKKSVSKASKSAKVPVLPLWLPHKNPVRDINTSTR
uniref:Uncharacterized protein LOC111110020 n=1 Tax=Crassostrea virginica TaxID=6565 RepID=A0A8B8BFA2_CRAVI|nr:uncharacterized protein LOC111110020 [Crassostrea virginica]